MDFPLKEIIWKQFGASIDMLENAITGCPAELWNTDTKFWYNAYHSLFYLDYYLDADPDNFLPPSPFTLSDFNPDGAMPERVYSREELLNYLHFCRNKCSRLIAALTPEKAVERWTNGYKNYTLVELLLYNMRHVQHHTAQLNLLLRQGASQSSKWISQTSHELPL